MYQLIRLPALFLAISAAGLAAEKEKPPNVIVIFCDDLGYGELPVYRKLYKGSDPVQTAIGSFSPRLDRLAEEGVVCTRAYGNNTCAPARMSLLSGKWPNRQVTLGGQPLIGRYMRQAGLKTAHYGKYHHEVETSITIPYHAEHLEFDEFFGFEAMTNYFRKAGEVVAPRGNSPITYRVGEKLINYQFPEKGAYMTDTLTDLSVDFINRCSKDGNPFFLYIPFNAPHSPIQAKEEDLKTLFPNQGGNASPRQKIMAMVHAVDRGIGRLVETLEKNGQLDRTLIIFTGDNGGEENQSLTYPMHGFKHEPCDGGIRVPFIVWSRELSRFPNKPDHYDGLVSLCDILPTALRYVDPLTDTDSLKSDGTDLMPHLSGRKPPLEQRVYLNLRDLNHRSNTWAGRKGEKEKKEGSCIALIADDFKIMKLWPDARKKSDYSYILHHLPDMIGKDNPQSSLKEDYFKDTASDPGKKEALIKRLEEILK